MLTRRITFDKPRGHYTNARLEWLVTNGLGGYSSGPVIGGLTRRFHGLLIAALPAPLGRMLFLNLLRVSLRVGDVECLLEHEDPGRVDAGGGVSLREFRLELGLPVWRYEVGGVEVEKRIVMPHRQNTAVVVFRALDAPRPVRLHLEPLFQVRPHEGPLSPEVHAPERVTVGDRTVELQIASHLPSLRWAVVGERPSFAFGHEERVHFEYISELRRGYEHAGGLWGPGAVEVDLTPGKDAAFVASTEPCDAVCSLTTRSVLDAEVARRQQLLAEAGPCDDPFTAELVLAADQFLITPAGRAEEVARVRNMGDEPRTVIAGYHWFTDWGRDTMISLEGLTLVTGRPAEAGSILRTFGRHIRNGLIPNMFPEGERLGLYHTADATLWFFHALARYVEWTGDRATLIDLLPKLIEIVDLHLAGTDFGIHVDPEDGLLRQGAEGYQLTWMDAKVGDWVVTPRRGKAVEINALWYNALRLLAGWLDEVGHKRARARCQVAADQAFAAFNRRFWNPDTRSLFDVVDGEAGDDPACRPNQIFAVSLPHAILERDRWAAVLDVVERQLVTPFGLRTLAPGHPEYQRKYYGDLRARDAAYHQGTVWAWLVGPFVDAWMKVHAEDRRGAHAYLRTFISHLSEAGVGSISEIFDAEAPYTPRGCIAQAWSVAEVLRAWRQTMTSPPGSPNPATVR